MIIESSIEYIFIFFIEYKETITKDVNLERSEYSLQPEYSGNTQAHACRRDMVMTYMTAHVWCGRVERGGCGVWLALL